MSNSRPESVARDQRSISPSDFVRPIIQTLLTGFVVAVMTTPVDVWQTQQQLKAAHQLPKMGLLPWLSTLAFAMRASMVKSACVSNHETIGGHVEKAVGSKETSSFEGMHADFEFAPSRVKWASTFLTAGTISTIDTLAAHIFGFSNYRVWLAVHGKTPNFETFGEGCKANMVGFTPRLYRNFIGAIFCISSMTHVQNSIEKLIPPLQGKLTAAFLSTIVCGAISGVLTNGLDIVYKYKVAGTNLETLQSPGSITVAKDIFQKEGIKGFTKGSGLSMIYMTLAFGGVNIVDMGMNYYFYTLGEIERNNKLKNTNKMFFPAKQTNVNKALTQETEKSRFRKNPE